MPLLQRSSASRLFLLGLSQKHQLIKYPLADTNDYSNFTSGPPRTAGRFLFWGTIIKGSKNLQEWGRDRNRCTPAPEIAQKSVRCWNSKALQTSFPAGKAPLTQPCCEGKCIAWKRLAFPRKASRISVERNSERTV